MEEDEIRSTRPPLAAHRIGRRRAFLLSGSLALAALALASAPARASTYYVNDASSSCSNSGPGTPSNPYCTISAALTAHHSAGTTIVVMPGTYREQVTLPASGSSGSPIVLQGSGGAGKVIVSGADDFAHTSLWQKVSGNVWRASSVSWKPNQVFADGARLEASTATASSIPSGSFEWVSGQGLYVNVGGDNPGSHRAEVGHRSACFALGARSWVTVDGFTATRAETYGIRMTEGGTNLVVTHDIVTFSGMYGLVADGCTSVRIGSDVATDNGYHGIALTGGTTKSTVEDNESARNIYPPVREANGLYCFGASSNLIRRNRFHDNQDTGLQLSGASNDNICQQNLSWHNGDHGYDNLHVTGNVHIGDVAWGNHKDGFSIEGSSTGHVLFDCVATDNGLTTNEFDLWVDAASVSGFVSNDNLFWNSTSQPPVKFISTLYAKVSSYSAASGQDTRTLQADPRFASPSAGDFHLVEGSPAIDSGNSGAPDWPSTDAEGRSRRDDPNTKNTGRGPISYADRGALEYQPPASPAAVEPGMDSTAAGNPAPAKIAPNPVRDRAILTFSIARTGPLSVRIFDVAGRIVATPADEVQAEPGPMTLRLDAHGRGARLDPGLYFYEIFSEGRRETGRFVVVK